MGDSSPHSAQEKLTAWLAYERLPLAERPEEHEFGWQYDPRSDVQSLLEQYQALRDAAERVVGADNQSLGAMGQEGERAMVEMTDALYALRVLIEASSPAKRPT